LLRVGDAYFGAGELAVCDCCGWRGGLRVGGLAECGGEEQLAGGNGGDQVGAKAPAGEGKRAGHQGGERFERGGAAADLGEQAGGVEDTEGGCVEQAGAGQLLPGVGGGEYVRG
jgi:hypothetical protein